MSKESFSKWTAIVANDAALQKQVSEAQAKITSGFQEVFDLASAKGISLEITDFFAAPSTSPDDSELAAAAGGGSVACDLTMAGVTVACAAGAILTLGIAAAASVIGGGSAKVGSAIANA
jgi:hypothetical protein